MNILSQIAHKFDATPYNRYVMIICPYHSGGDRENMIVFPDRATCYSCGKSVPTEQLLTAGSSILPSPRIRTKGKFYNPFTRWMKTETLGEALQIAWKNNSKSPNYYLQKRKISPEDQVRLGIGYRDDWITFPIRNQEGKVIGATARAGEQNTSSAKYCCPKGQDPKLLYFPNQTLMKGKDYLYLTFGIIDALSISLLGEPSASTTTGKQLNPTALDWFRGNIFIVPDYKEELSAYRLAKALGLRGKVIFPEYDTTTNDPADLYVKGRLQNVLILRTV